MSDFSDIPDEVCRFVGCHIRSIAALEALIFLYQNSETSWSPSQLAIELRSNTSHAMEILEDLNRSGLIQKLEDRMDYILNPQMIEEKAIIDEICQLYYSKRTSMIQLIYQSPTEKLRSFADAFKIRK